MSNVIIYEKALDTAVRHAQGSPDNEIIGVLVGRQKGTDLVITDAIPSQHGHADNVSVSLLNEFQALVAEKLMRGGSNDYIVGIYHSHPGFGCFFSDTDIGTQQRIQQMFPQAVAMVIDPFQKTGIDYRFYRVESGKAIELTPMLAREPKIPEPKKPAVPPSVPVARIPVPQPADSRLFTYLAIAAIIISICALIVAGMTFSKISSIESQLSQKQVAGNTLDNSGGQTLSTPTPVSTKSTEQTQVIVTTVIQTMPAKDKNESKTE